MTLQTWIFGAALATTTVLSAKEPVSIRVSPAVSFAPANVIVRTRLEPDADNRALEIVADSDRFYRSSTIGLDGDRAPKTVILEYRSLPPGEYKVSAAVIGAAGQRRALARTQVNVIESGVSSKE